MELNKKYIVWSINKSEKRGTVWIKAGAAFANKDGSANVYLDVLPLDGKLHIREPGEQHEARGEKKQQQQQEQQPQQNNETNMSMGGH